MRAQIQLLRNMADAGSLVGTIPDPPVPELWGLDPVAAASNFDHYFFKGKAPLWNDMTGVWASSPTYASTILGVYNQMLIFGGLPGQCPADGLTFGPLVAAGPCPVSIRQPGRAMATTFTDGLYVVNGNGNVSTYGGAPNYGSPTFGSDWARDIAVMPDGAGYVVLSADGHLYRYGSAASPATLGSLAEPPWEWGADVARSLAITPDGKGLLILNANGDVYKAGTAASGALAGLGSPSVGDSAARDRGDARRRGLRRARLVGPRVEVRERGVRVRGRAETPIWYFSDTARDIVIASWMGVGFGYYVLDGNGRVWNGGIVPAVTNAGVGRRRPLPVDHVPLREAVRAAQRRRRVHDEADARPRSEHDDGAQHLAALHLVERVLDVVEADGLAHEALEVEAPVEVQVDEHREVARREAVAVPARLERAAATEELDHRQLDAHRRVGHAHLHDGAREVARVERLLEHLGATDRFDADVGAVAVGERADRFDGIGVA